MTRFLGILFSILFGIAAALAIAELAIHYVNLYFPYFTCYDPDRGWALRPGVSGWWHKEGASVVSINQGGFRGPEVMKAKPPGTVRIAMLGDSYTQAIQVPYEQTFCAVSAQKLAECPAVAGLHVQSLNLGVDGYGTAQELITLRRQAWAYSPDIVVLALFLGNDVRNNSVVLETNQCRPFYVYKDGKLAAAGPFVESPEYRAWCMARFDFRNVGLFALLKNGWEILRDYEGRPTAEYPAEAAINYDVYRPPVDQAWKDAWQVTEELVTEMHKEVAAHHAMFLVVTLDTAFQVWPDPKARARFAKFMKADDLFYPDERIAALGKREGFEVLTLAKPLQEYAESHHVYLHGFPNSSMGFGHWNADGHRLAGELIGEKLCTMIGRGECSSCAAKPKAAGGAPPAP